MADAATVPDAIERRIHIDADAAEVWSLISEPGWWINDGEYRPHRIEHVGDGDGAEGTEPYERVHDEVHGVFAIRVGELREPRYARFEWLDEEPGGSSGGSPRGTAVEFFVDDRPGGVVLRVRESGFASLSVDEAERRRRYDDNSEGWETELAVARGRVAPSAPADPA